MVDESDGIEEAIEGQTRLLITAAAQAGDRIARMREDALRRAQATSEREARELQSRLAGEQRAVRADLSGVQRAEWWENASPERIAQAYESAVAWRDEEPEAARAEQRIIDELRTRHGITPDQLRAQVAAERGERGPARYVLTEGYDDRKTTRDISRDDALALVDRTPRAGDLTPTRRQQFEDMRGWIGQDRDVDLAIAAKFPQIMTEEQQAAVRRAEVEQQRSSEPRFEVYQMVQEHDSSRDLGKAGALEMIEKTAGTQPGTESRQLGNDMRQWGARTPTSTVRWLRHTLSSSPRSSWPRSNAPRPSASDRPNSATAPRRPRSWQRPPPRRTARRSATRTGRTVRLSLTSTSSAPRAHARRPSPSTTARSAVRPPPPTLKTRATITRPWLDRCAPKSPRAPATEATKDSRAPRARKSRGRSGANRQRERGGLTR